METFNDLREREIRPNYNVHKLHHYTTMIGLGSILRKGYIEARESKGDADFGDMIKNHKAVSFLDGDYDNELKQFYQCNDQGLTLEGRTLHLGLHQKTVCALIEVDLDKLPEDSEVELLETISKNLNDYIDYWNVSVYDGAEIYRNAKILYDTKMEFHNNKNYNNDELKAELIKRGVTKDFMREPVWGRECEFDRYGDPFPDYSQKVLKDRVTRASLSKDIKLEKMTDEEIAKMKQAVKDIDLRTLYVTLRKKGVPARWFQKAPARDISCIGDMESKSWEIGSLIRLLFDAAKRSPAPFYGPTFEMRIPENILIDADNCRIYIFENMIQGDVDKDRVEKVLAYNDSHKHISLQVLKAGDRINN